MPAPKDPSKRNSYICLFGRDAKGRSTHGFFTNMGKNTSGGDPHMYLKNIVSMKPNRTVGQASWPLYGHPRVFLASELLGREVRPGEAYNTTMVDVLALFERMGIQNIMQRGLGGTGREQRQHRSSGTTGRTHRRFVTDVFNNGVHDTATVVAIAETHGRKIAPSYVENLLWQLRTGRMDS